MDPIFYRDRQACPNAERLQAFPNALEAMRWAIKAPTQASEVSRVAEVETWFGLTRAASNDLHRAALDKPAGS